MQASSHITRKCATRKHANTQTCNSQHATRKSFHATRKNFHAKFFSCKIFFIHATSFFVFAGNFWKFAGNFWKPDFCLFLPALAFFWLAGFDFQKSFGKILGFPFTRKEVYFFLTKQQIHKYGKDSQITEFVI